MSCGGGGTPTMEQQAQSLDTAPQQYSPDSTHTGLLAPAWHAPIPEQVLNCANPKQISGAGLAAFENLNGISFNQAYQNIITATPGVSAAVAQGWTQVHTGIEQASQTFAENIGTVEASADAWSGQTHTAMINNLNSAMNTLATISAGVSKLGQLTNTFSNTLENTQSAFISQYPAYLAAMSRYGSGTTNQAVVEWAFNNYAQSVLTHTYAPNIQQVASTPVTFPATTPTLGSPPGSTPTTAGGASSSAPAVAGANGIASSGLTGASATPADATLDSASTPEPTPTSGLSTGTSNPAAAATDPAAAAAAADPSSGLSNLGDELSPLAEGLMSPMQSLGQLASMGAQGAKPPGGMPPGTPLKPGQLANLKGGGGGGGAGVHSPQAKLASALSAGGMSPRTVAAGSRAGLSGAPGGAAAGAPVGGGGGGGHQGGAQGGAHQPNKVLRRKKNGEDIIGEAEAVVPVLGETARTEAGAKPDAT